MDWAVEIAKTFVEALADPVIIMCFFVISVLLGVVFCLTKVLLNMVTTDAKRESTVVSLMKSLNEAHNSVDKLTDSLRDFLSKVKNQGDSG